MHISKICSIFVVSKLIKYQSLKIIIMKTNYEFVTSLFNKAEKLPSFGNTNNYQTNFYRVEISSENKIQLESGCINEFGERFFNNDLREYTPSYNEYKKLLNISKGKSVFFVYED